MMTDFCDFAIPACASARSSCGNDNPPSARPPSCRKLRRDSRSQKRCDGPTIDSMIDPFGPNISSHSAVRDFAKQVENHSATVDPKLGCTKSPCGVDHATYRD